MRLPRGVKHALGFLGADGCLLPLRGRALYALRALQDGPETSLWC